MTEPVVERGTRETSLPSVGRAHLRIALRGLVVAGSAGGVWPLSSSAASAAEGHTASALDSTDKATGLVAGLGGNGVDDFLGLGSTVPPTTGEPLTRIPTPSHVTTIVRAAGVATVANVGGTSAGHTDVTGVGMAGPTGLVDTLDAGGTVPAPGAAPVPPGHLTAAPAVGQQFTMAAVHPAGGQAGHRPRTGSVRSAVSTVYRSGRVGSRHGPVQPNNRRPSRLEVLTVT